MAEVDDVAAWLVSTGLRHLTVSGGEPVDQAGSLVALIDLVRSAVDWVVTLYTGYLRQDLELHRPASGTELLERVDLLIDGPYVEAEHAPLLWRGSRNQGLHALSDRVELPDDDRSAGVAVHVAGDGGFEVIGVPPTPGFVGQLTATMSADGAPVEIDRSQTFPFPVHEEDA